MVWAVIVDDSVEAGGDRDFAAARYNPTALLTPRRPFPVERPFDDDGKVTTDLNNQRNEAYGLAIQMTGKFARGIRYAPIVSVDNLPKVTQTDFALIRYNTDGSLDDGTLMTPPPAVTLVMQVSSSQTSSATLTRRATLPFKMTADRPPRPCLQSSYIGGPGFGFLFAAARYEAGESADLSVEVTDAPDPVVQ